MTKAVVAAKARWLGDGSEGGGGCEDGGTGDGSRALTFHDWLLFKHLGRALKYVICWIMLFRLLSPNRQI